MSTKQQHKHKAQHNVFLRDELDNPFWDWKVIATFYAAAHYVEAYLVTINAHSADHGVRDSTIQRNATLKPIWTDYKLLKEDSRDARYNPHIPFGQADAIRVQNYLALATVKNRIGPLI